MFDIDKLLKDAENIGVKVINTEKSIILKETTCLFDIWAMGCGDTEKFDELTKSYFDNVKEMNKNYYKNNEFDICNEGAISFENYSKAGFYDPSCFKIIELIRYNGTYKVNVYFILLQGEKFIVDDFVLEKEEDFNNLLEWCDYFYKEW